MTIPAITPPPSPEKRAEMISKADTTELEKIRQHALAMMSTLTKGRGTVPPEYTEWSDFVGGIEAELRRRKS